MKDWQKHAVQDFLDNNWLKFLDYLIDSNRAIDREEAEDLAIEISEALE